MLRDMLENSDFDKKKFLRKPAIGPTDQVLQWGYVSRLGILFFDGQVGHEQQNLDVIRLIIKSWYRYF